MQVNLLFMNNIKNGSLAYVHFLGFLGYAGFREAKTRKKNGITYLYQ